MSEIDNEKLEALSKLRVLLVEDEEFARKAYNQMLKRRVKELYLAENGEVGLALFKEHKPDVVVTDLEMPIMNGLEMIKHIKKIKEEMPIIVVTAFEDEAPKAEGADDIIIKPVKKDILLNKLIELTQKG